MKLNNKVFILYLLTT